MAIHWTRETPGLGGHDRSWPTVHSIRKGGAFDDPVVLQAFADTTTRSLLVVAPHMDRAESVVTPLVDLPWHESPEMLVIACDEHMRYLATTEKGRDRTADQRCFASPW